MSVQIHYMDRIDGCYYYNGIAAPELQSALEALNKALEERRDYERRVR